MQHRLRSLLTIFLFLSSGPILGQKKVTLGPAIGLVQTSYGSTENFFFDLDDNLAPAFGLSARLFDGKVRLRTDALYHSYSITSTEERMLSVSQFRTRIIDLEQSGVMLSAGGEYHLKEEGLRPFFGGGLMFNILLNYRTVQSTSTNLTGTSTNINVRVDVDDDPSGGEYGIYLNGGLALNRLSIEIRFISGSRNRSDFSIPFTRLSLFGAYFF